VTAPEPKDLAAQIKKLHGDVTFELQLRERPDRHPYQTGCLSGLLVVSIAQMILGLPPESALYKTVGYATVVALNIPFVVGSAMALAGAILNRERRFELSLRLGIFGHLSLFVAALCYTLFVMVATHGPGDKPYWIAVTSVGLSVGIAYASVQRFRQMRKLLAEYRRRERERN